MRKTNLMQATYALYTPFSHKLPRHTTGDVPQMSFRFTRTLLLLCNERSRRHTLHMQRCVGQVVSIGVGSYRHAKLSESYEVREAIRSFAVSQSFYLQIQDIHELVIMKTVTKMRSYKIMKTTIKMVKAMKNALFS